MAPEPMSEPVDRLKCPNCGQTGPHFVIGDPGAFACEPTPTSGYFQTDAPPCPTCGSIMVPSGPPFRCLNCAPPAAWEADALQKLNDYKCAMIDLAAAQAQVAALREALAPFVNDGREIRDCCGEDGYDNHPDLIVALDAAEAALAPPPASASDPKEAK